MEVKNVKGRDELVSSSSHTWNGDKDTGDHHVIWWLPVMFIQEAVLIQWKKAWKRIRNISVSVIASLCAFLFFTFRWLLRFHTDLSSQHFSLMTTASTCSFVNLKCVKETQVFTLCVYLYEHRHPSCARGWLWKILFLCKIVLFSQNSVSSVWYTENGSFTIWRKKHNSDIKVKLKSNIFSRIPTKYLKSTKIKTPCFTLIFNYVYDRDAECFL